MALVKNIATFKKYVRYNFAANDIGSLLDTAPVEREIILPLIGQTLYTDLQTQVNADAITKPDLLDIVRAAIVPLTVYNELPTLQVQLGDSGLRKLLSENTQGAFRWEYNEVKDLLEDKGCKAIDQLIVYLYANKVALAWTAPVTMGVVFKTGSDFKRFYGLKYPERTFLTLSELVNEVEDQYISPSIGKPFLVELIAKDAPSELEKEAIGYIKKSVANYTAMKAIEKKPIRITPHGLFVMIGDSADDKNPKEKTASVPQYAIQRDAAERDADSYLQRLKALLNANASAEVFTTYFGSSYYKSPAATAAAGDPNENRKVYGF